MMYFLARIIVFLLCIIACFMLIPLAFAIYFSEVDVYLSFIIPIAFCFLLGLLAFFFKAKKKQRLPMRLGFLVVALSWLFSCLLGSIPFMISGYIPSFFDAFFESVSGFTTTGASILSSVEALPFSLNIWRAEMHWLGGMGIVAITVALMPLLGIGGFQLIKAETTGPDKGKITPKIRETAKKLWIFYVILTFLQVILLLFAKMSFTEAVFHSFATLGTGGFSMKNSGLASYSASAQWICTVFMILAGVNFSLYFLLWNKKRQELLKNTECKVYFSIIFIASFFVFLSIYPLYGKIEEAMRHAFFQVASILTTTGFATRDFTLWPGAAQSLLFFLMFIGGSSGSTAGGIKVVRWTVLFKQATNEIKKMLHPHGVYTIRLNQKAGRKDLVFSVSAFVFLYFILVAISTVIASRDGVDLLSSFTASLSMVGNIGPGFGLLGPAGNYGFFSNTTKLWFSFAMLAGRLELYTLLIYFSPAFWKK